jgi:hypothetical protein
MDSFRENYQLAQLKAEVYKSYTAYYISVLRRECEKQLQTNRRSSLRFSTHPRTHARTTRCEMDTLEIYFTYQIQPKKGENKEDLEYALYDKGSDVFDEYLVSNSDSFIQGNAFTSFKVKIDTIGETSWSVTTRAYYSVCDD